MDSTYANHEVVPKYYAPRPASPVHRLWRCPGKKLLKISLYYFLLDAVWRSLSCVGVPAVSCNGNGDLIAEIASCGFRLEDTLPKWNIC